MRDLQDEGWQDKGWRIDSKVFFAHARA